MLCKYPYIKDGSGMGLLSKNPDKRATATPFGCGRCLPCKINKAREWTNRLMLEASSYKENIFLTLTYSNETLPNPPHVSIREIQLFIKRLRKNVYPLKFRYFAVGEYGTDTWRPHYHLAVFNYSPLDEKNIIKAWSKKGKQIGHILIGDLNKDSSRYITGYCIKKLTNENDAFTQERLNGKTPEFSTSSRQGGGIGAQAINEMSDKIKRQKYFNKNKIKIIRECSLGKNKLPLGRYLTNRLKDNLDMSDKESYELFAYQEKIKEEALDPGGFFYTNLEENLKPKINSMEKKHQLYNKRTNTL